MRTISLFTWSLCIVLCFSCKKKQEEIEEVFPPDPVEVLPSRAEVIQDYNDIYLGSQLFSNGWTGSVNGCVTGDISDSARYKALQRINYFRKLVRLNANTTWNPSLFSRLQKTALVMQANNTITHTPPNTFACWSNEAYLGAQYSNLNYFSGSNYSTSQAVTDQILDPGPSNAMVAHRRWLLHSKKSKFSIGASNSVVAIAIIGLEETNTNIPNFIAYPAKGFFPKPLVFDKWSFGKPMADFSNATVTMIGPNGPVSLQILSRDETSVGDNTIVWEPQGIDLSQSTDVTYTVTISGIRNAYKESYTYDVVIVNP